MFDKSRSSKRHQLLLIVIVVFLLLMAVFWFSFGRYLLPIEKASFIQEHTGQIQGEVNVSVPEVYELANIIIPITDYRIEDQFRVYKDGAYYQEVIEYFDPYRDHPLISKFNFSVARIN